MANSVVKPRNALRKSKGREDRREGGIKWDESLGFREKGIYT